MIYFFWFYFLSLIASQSAMDFCHFVILLMFVYDLIKNRSSSVKFLKVIVSQNKLIIFSMCTIFIAGILSLVFSPLERSLIEYKELIEFKWILEIFTLMFFFKKIKWSEKIVHQTFAIYLIGIVYALYAHLSGVYPLNPEINLLSLGDDPYLKWRAGGLFEHYMPFSHTYGPLLMMYLVFYTKYFRNTSFKKNIYLNLSLIVGLALSIFTMYLTYTRGLWLAMAIVFFVFIFFKLNRNIKVTVTLLITLFLSIAFTKEKFRDRIFNSLQQNGSYDSDRMILWKTHFEMFKEHLTTGVGYNHHKKLMGEYYDRHNYPENQLKSHAHNNFFHWFSTTGILGGFSFILFIFGIILNYFKSHKQIRQNNKFLRQLQTALFGGLVCFLLAGMTESSFFIAKNRYLFLFLTSLLLSLKFFDFEDSDFYKSNKQMPK